MRMWELDGRTMHYDEAIHVHFSWKLFKGEGYVHSPWMHGPFQIELTALVFKLLEDNDHTARLAYVIFGTALAGLPYYLRRHIGGAGALLTGLMLCPVSEPAVFQPLRAQRHHHGVLGGLYIHS